MLRLLTELDKILKTEAAGSKEYNLGQISVWHFYLSCTRIVSMSSVHRLMILIGLANSATLVDLLSDMKTVEFYSEIDEAGLWLKGGVEEVLGVLRHNMTRIIRQLRCSVVRRFIMCTTCRPVSGQVFDFIVDRGVKV